VAEPLAFDVPLTLPAQIDARAEHPITADRPVLIHDERRWTYAEFRDECVRTAHFLRGRLGPISETRPGHVAMMLENHLELLSLLGGCGFGGMTLFGVNTGLRGDVLSGVVDQSRSRVLIVDEKLYPEVERVARRFKHVAPENILVLPTQGGAVPGDLDLRECMENEVAPAGTRLEAPDVQITPETNLMVIYTSGTTGLPKGILNNHLKLLVTGIGLALNLELTYEDVGYGCVPLFHSNGMFVGFMPCFWAGAAMGLRERFTASGFLADVKRYGVTFWNYVGEPVHYVVSAIERQCQGDAEKIAAEVTSHAQNRLRYAVGNGAAPPDIDRLAEYLGLEHVFEFYGSTEAAISVFRQKGTPRGSVGELTDEQVKILDEHGVECPPAEIDEAGTILNYEDCVGEISRVAEDTGLFQGYFDDEEAGRAKYRDGVYHSGDLGHVLIREGRRYLYFDGRTDDWIRKDGENFSAAQVGRLISEHPDVQLAVAYGVPCAVSDELVMTAMLLRPGARFDPRAFFDWCQDQVANGSMDAKWIPDFVRLVQEFEYTETQKVLVRQLKKLHFDLRRLPQSELPIFFRERGDRAFRELSSTEYDRLRQQYAGAERLQLLDR